MGMGPRETHPPQSTHVHMGIGPALGRNKKGESCTLALWLEECGAKCINSCVANQSLQEETKRATCLYAFPSAAMPHDEDQTRCFALCFRWLSFTSRGDRWCNWICPISRIWALRLSYLSRSSTHLQPVAYLWKACLRSLTLKNGD